MNNVRILMVVPDSTLDVLHRFQVCKKLTILGMIPALELDVRRNVVWTCIEVNLLGLIVARVSSVAELVHHAFTDAEDS